MKNHSFLRYFLIFFLIALTFFASMSFYVLAQVKTIVDSRVGDSSIDGSENPAECGMLGCLQDIVFNKSCPIKVSEDRTNILLLGAGGTSQIQGGSILTDTIIVLSISRSSGNVSMISIPRDLWVRPPGFNEAKINTLYGTSLKYYDNGFTIPKATIEDLIGLPIHYYTFIDFVAFEKVIDALGGVDVVVEKAFQDNTYPDGNFGYLTINFEAGATKMNGETALQYVRSRHGTNGESSDFARSRRQHKIITAIKDKILSFGTLFKIDSISEAIKNNYTSNIKPCEIYGLLMIAKDVNKENIRSLVLDDGPSGLLYVPTIQLREAAYSGAYILLPDGNNYNIIKKYVSKFLKNPDMLSKGPSVDILNGSGKEGLANKVGALLMSNGYRVLSRENTYGRRAYPECLIFAEKPGEYYETILDLQNLIGAKVVGENPEPIKTGADLVIIIGSNFDINRLEELNK